MIKFYRTASIVLAVVGSVGFAVLLYLHGGGMNAILRHQPFQDFSADVHIMLMGGSFTCVILCALMHSFYLHEKQMRWW